jgi:hypothetical protein
MSASQRAKGRKGQSDAMALLNARDWDCGDLSAGISSEDILAFCPEKQLWCVEVKNTVSINVRAFRSQAAKNSVKRRNGKWMVMARIDGYAGAWLVLRQGMTPAVWSAAQ